MSLSFIVVLLVTLVLVLSQFGSRLAARNALSWYLVSGFLLFAAIWPEGLLPVTRFFGVELVSNFVLAVLTMFLFIQLFEQFADGTHQQRKLAQLVSATAERSSPPSADAPPRALVVLPCFNEEANLGSLIPRLEALRRSHPDIDYCFVDDGSLDSSPRALEVLAPGRHVSHLTNIGISGVLRTGFRLGRRKGARFVVQCDSDGQHPIEEIPRLLQLAEERGLDLLVGSRFVAPDGPQLADPLASTTRLRRFGGWFVSNLLGLFGARARLSDPTSGFRVYSRRAVAALLKEMPDEYPEPESIALLALRRLQLGEAKVAMEPRLSGVSSLSGVKSLRFMIKVTSALLGLRLRSLLVRHPPLADLESEAWRDSEPQKQDDAASRTGG